MPLAQLLQHALSWRASDLHLSSGLPPMLRVDGDLQRLDLPVLDSAHIQRLLQSVTPAHVQAASANAQEYDFAFECAGLARVRAHVFQQARGLALALRILPSTLPSLDALGVPSLLPTLLQRPHGLILLTGATGTGKSTTLAALLAHLNQTRCAHIITIEDPIEWIYTPQQCLIQQRELHRDTASFEQGLRAALRQDPDVIMLGELRDTSTIQLALSAAETGHLVLASLHTSTAARAVDRIIDVFPASAKPMVRTMLSGSLLAVIAQALPKRIEGGRVAAFEIMLATPAIANLIREGKPAQMYSAIQSGHRHGMQTLDQALQVLVEGGVIAPSEAARYAQGPMLA